MLHAVLDHVLVRHFLLLEDVRFHLVHCRDDLSKLAEIDEPIWIEVADADRPQLACFECILHRAVSAVVITEWLVDQHQVDVIALQIRQGLVNRCRCTLVARVRHPYLRCQKKFLTRHATAGHRLTDCCFVAV